ncbi:MAG: helix-turn-helix transcriptional regulator [Arcobacteraceae bacterium]
MTKANLTKILKEINLSKKEFANLSNISYNTVNNWNDENKPVPPWIDSWLENYTDSKILKTAENYFNNMSQAYDIAIEMDRSEGIHYYRIKKKEYYEEKYSNLPIWLIASLEAQDYYHERIILNPRKKDNDAIS